MVRGTVGKRMQEVCSYLEPVLVVESDLGGVSLIWRHNQLTFLALWVLSPTGIPPASSARFLSMVRRADPTLLPCMGGSTPSMLTYHQSRSACGSTCLNSASMPGNS